MKTNKEIIVEDEFEEELNKIMSNINGECSSVFVDGWHRALEWVLD